MRHNQWTINQADEFSEGGSAANSATPREGARRKMSSITKSEQMGIALRGDSLVTNHHQVANCSSGCDSVQSELTTSSYCQVIL